ncbi:response regulator [Desulfogranum japonicum]|uniref:response regulator n=1 Tax=Desulfogranum japonicum TaxID=231447 RepID=UPI00048FB9B2|nr:response regulator transcription factor [Desulfogranum japonicum]
MTIRIFLADDHHLMREGLRALLISQPDFEVVGEAENGREAVALCKKIQPDVALMDVSMPEMNGIEATRQIVTELISVKVIALSMYADRRFVEGMMKVGISGYLLKNCLGEELFSAIHKVVKGEVYLSPQLSGTIMSGYARLLKTEKETVTPSLTYREQEILQLLAEGHDVKRIAHTLYISTKTVETHRRNIMKKLNAKSMVDLVHFALRNGLTSL